MKKDNKPLRESSASHDGITAGALQDAKKSDLERGFAGVKENHRHDFPVPYRSSLSGFLGRPNGWER